MASGIRNLGPDGHTEAAFQGFVNRRSRILAILETARGEEDLWQFGQFLPAGGCINLSELRSPVTHSVGTQRLHFVPTLYRILYGFVGKDAAILACGLTKQRAVPSGEIDRAALRINKYEKNPAKHRYVYEEV